MGVHLRQTRLHARKSCKSEKRNTSSIISTGILCTKELEYKGIYKSSWMPGISEGMKVRLTGKYRWETIWMTCRALRSTQTPQEEQVWTHCEQNAVHLKGRDVGIPDRVSVAAASLCNASSHVLFFFVFPVRLPWTNMLCA